MITGEILSLEDRETRDIALPISGKKIVIREGDGYSTRALLKKNKRIYDSVFDYLASMVVTIDDRPNISRSDVLKLLTPDQEFLSIEAYRLNYGDDFEFEFSCPSCDAESDQIVNLTKLTFIELSKELTGPDPIINITLPKSKKTAVVGMLTGEKELDLLMLAATTGPDINQASFKALRALDGEIDFSFEDVIVLPLADHKAIRKARKKLICGYDTNISVTCPKCEESFVMNILVHRDFLLPAG